MAKKSGKARIVEWKSKVARRRMGKRLLTLVAERKKFRDIARKMSASTHIVKEGWTEVNVIWCIKKLVFDGADLEYVNNENNNAVMIAAQNGHCLILRHILTNYTMDYNQQNSFGFNVCMLALMNDKVEQDIISEIFTKNIKISHLLFYSLCCFQYSPKKNL